MDDGTRSTFSTVTFTRRFKLPNMDEAFPPGIYEIETDETALDVHARLAYRRTATRIWLQKGGTTQVLQVDPKTLDDALAADAAPQ